ncbi:MAG: hypothetical protein KJ597_04950 [Nanoarchaeota archaeon]|nr:hypothetical protein [Nanoarchaeota archaeon]
MIIQTRGIKAWISILIFIAIVIILLVFIFNLIVLLLPVIIIILVLSYFFGMLNKVKKEKPKNNVIDVKYKVKR